jgi:hypothetical protein
MSFNEEQHMPKRIDRRYHLNLHNDPQKSTRSHAYADMMRYHLPLMLSKRPQAEKAKKACTTILSPEEQSDRLSLPNAEL